MRESEWIKIGADNGAGKTALLQNVTFGKRMSGDVNLTFRTSTGELAKSGKRFCVEGCVNGRISFSVRGVETLVYNPLLSVGEHTTMGGAAVMYGDKCYLFHKGSSVAKKIGSRRRSAKHNITVAQLRSKKQRVQHPHDARRKRN